MFVNQVIFEGAVDAQDKIINKVKHTMEELQDVAGLNSAECWNKDTKNNDTIAYSIVTKWNEKADFVAWISRESHVAEHRAMRKEKKDQAPVMTKTLLQYEEASFA
ncbi:antibiotic biosynthesis monooxygenase [Terribacillus saccharophilus]|uniref:antibiotic biosynthesis monooxygenase n=1 Tax=Terribacillus saccharophilus TaxID=361277 RepID=UPI003981D4E0